MFIPDKECVLCWTVTSMIITTLSVASTHAFSHMYIQMTDEDSSRKILTMDDMHRRKYWSFWREVKSKLLFLAPNYDSAVFRRYLCLEWTLMEQIKLMFSLKSELTSMSICSIRTRSRDWDTFEKSLQLNFNPSVHILEFYH